MNEMGEWNLGERKWIHIIFVILGCFTNLLYVPTNIIVSSIFVPGIFTQYQGIWVYMQLAIDLY